LGFARLVRRAETFSMRLCHILERVAEAISSASFSISAGSAVVLFRVDMSHQNSLSGDSLQLRAPGRKDWLFVRKEALVSLADGALSARDPTAPSALADPGLVLVRAGSLGPLG
jgi:hypothetical protein